MEGERENGIICYRGLGGHHCCCGGIYGVSSSGVVVDYFQDEAERRIELRVTFLWSKSNLI